MKAPDKIYLNIPKVLYENDEEIVATWDTQEWDDCVNPEYIRKDLLLEWAKEQSASCDGSVAMKRAYDKLIEKLNTL